MKRILFVLLLALPLSGIAQLREFLYWDANAFPKNSYALNEVKVLDQRGDTTALLGFVHRNLTTAKVKLLTKKPLDQLLTELYTGTAGKNGPQYDLLVLLHHFYIYEEPGLAYEKGRFRFKADYFLAEKGKGKYRLLKQVDTLFLLKGYDVNTRIHEAAGLAIASACANCVFDGRLPAYTYEEASHFDDQIVKAIPAYSVTEYPENAVYPTWNDFLRQQPAKDQSVTTRGGIFFLQHLNTKGKIGYEPFYDCRVFSFANRLYYATSLGKFEIYRRHNDFFIATKADLLDHATAGPSYIPPVTDTTDHAGENKKKRHIRDMRYEYRIDRKAGVLFLFH